MPRTPDEQETTFRWDEAERTLWACTTTPRIAGRWQRAGYPVTIIGRERDSPASWEVKLPWSGTKRPWMRLISLGMSQWNAPARSTDPEPVQDGLDPSAAV
jgi:hypothetical protein